jgi:predicted ATP-dependent endonuclease of OLD family
MEPKIGTLTIKRFRALRHLKIEGLGRVNLITGKNNTGKSSVLEALRILASDAAPSVIYSILSSCEENLGESEVPASPLDVDYLFPWSSLFYRFPRVFPENRAY